MIVIVDTGALVALLDAADKHHAEVLEIYDADPEAWVLPWVILPEVDYLLATHVSRAAAETFLADLADGNFTVDWGEDSDLKAAGRLSKQYQSLRLGLVDAVVMAVAERRKARAIATIDLKHFGAVHIKGTPRLLLRDA